MRELVTVYFNDVAVAAHYLLDRGYANRILIVDLDVHQGKW